MSTLGDSQIARHHDPAVRHLYQLQKDLADANVDESVKQGVAKALKLCSNRDAFFEKVSSEPSDALKVIKQETLDHPFEQAFKEGKTKWNLAPRMATGALEGNFLQSFVSASHATRVLDVGMFLGYSALALAEVLPPGGKVVTCDYEPYLEPVARGLFKTSPHGDKIDIRIGPAEDTLTALAKEGQQFNVVFIDANKDGYIAYYKAIMNTNLLARGGSLLLDNALMWGAAYTDPNDWAKTNTHGKYIWECNEFLQTQTDIHRVLVPIRDGVWIVRRQSDMQR